MKVLYCAINSAVQLLYRISWFYHFINIYVYNFFFPSPPNGIITTYMSKSSTAVKPGLLMQQPPSNDSSPVCSEYSSPPQSPSPAEACNQSSSLSSSNDENADKSNLAV